MNGLINKDVIASLSEETLDKIKDLILQDRNNIIKNKQSILDECVKEKLIKKSEVKDYSQDYLVEYLKILLDSKTDNIPIPDSMKKQIEEGIKKGKDVDKKIIFVTNHKEILKRKTELNKKFSEYILVKDELEAMMMASKEEDPTLYEDEDNKIDDKADYIG